MLSQRVATSRQPQLLARIVSPRIAIDVSRVGRRLRGWRPAYWQAAQVASLGQFAGVAGRCRIGPPVTAGGRRGGPARSPRRAGTRSRLTGWKVHDDPLIPDPRGYYGRSCEHRRNLASLLLGRHVPDLPRGGG